MLNMQKAPLQLLLADDDADDWFLFHEALEQIPVDTKLRTASNGSQLMTMLLKPTHHTDVLFLDLNMPLKNGLDCLKEIRANKVLRKLPVVIFSTSVAEKILGDLYALGAILYIKKPNSLSELKTVLISVLHLLETDRSTQPAIEKFVFTIDSPPNR